MKLIIDNFDGLGPKDYSVSVEEPECVTVHRQLNRPAEMHANLVSSVTEFIVPAAGARLQLVRNDGTKLFTGYLKDSAEYEYLGWTATGPAYRYKLTALSDEFVLDRKVLPAAIPIVGRTAGSALRSFTEEIFHGEFDTAGIDDVAMLASWEVDAQKKWSELAGDIAMQTRSAYRVLDGKIQLKAIPVGVHEIAESTPGLCPADLKIRKVNRIINDLTVIGAIEPQSYVKDWFCGDGLSLRFDLSQVPFTRQNRVLLDEEFKGGCLNPARWAYTGDVNAISVSGGKLQIDCGGEDRSTVVQLTEKLELGGALVVQHGQINFSAVSDGIVGGLYTGSVCTSNCVAGFQVSSDAGGAIQAVINGAASGAIMPMTANHQYAMTTRMYSSEVYRSNNVFHSSAHEFGNEETIDADVRMVLEVRDINPSSAGTGTTTVLYDGVVYLAPQWCTYALFNGGSLHCDVTFTRILRPVDAEVRSAPPGENYRTRLSGALSEGAECSVSAPTLQFFSAFVPPANEKIVVSYRGSGRAVARVNDPSSIAAQKRDNDNGVLGRICEVAAPAPRTSVDCTNAALAFLEDSVHEGWTGDYKILSDFLPAGLEIFPGDGVNVSAPSRQAEFGAIVREVHAKIRDLAFDRVEYQVRFADDEAEPFALVLRPAPQDWIPTVDSTPIPALRPPIESLTEAEVTNITSTAVDIDTGASLSPGFGIEARRSDAGWGLDNDRNLLGRFGTRIIELSRYSRVQTYFLRLYDNSAPPNYSAFSTAIHIDYPL